MQNFARMAQEQTDNTEQTNTPSLPSRYVQGPELLEALFAPECRPSIRWLRDHQHEMPFVRIGRLMFFDPPAVKAYFDAKHGSKHRGQRRIATPEVVL